MNVKNIDNLRLNIESLADEVSAEFGSGSVSEVFSMFGASGLDDLSFDNYEAVISELQRLVSDI